jgi:endonuclease/exonuclease/phosphatase family metal-dependent hydrolase
MTWNVENLFPPGSASGPPNSAVYRRKLARLSQTIGTIVPDVIALQELGHPDSLRDLQEALGGQYPHSAISSHPDNRGIRVAILSRRQLSDVRQVESFPPQALTNIPTVDGELLNSLSRGALHAVARVSGTRRVRVVTAHLKSKLLSYPGGRRFPLDEDERARGAGFALLRRTAEAVALRVQLNPIMTDDRMPTVLLGDFNDEASAITTQLLQGPPDAAPDRPDQGDDVRLNNLVDWLPRKHSYSRLFKGEGELIDHILVSQDLLGALRQVDSLVEDISSISEDVESRRNSTIPDHAPMFARFELD